MMIRLLERHAEKGLFGALILFIVLFVAKLFGVVPFSWFWVTSPLWGTVGGFFTTIGVLAVRAIIQDYKDDEHIK